MRRWSITAAIVLASMFAATTYARRDSKDSQEANVLREMETSSGEAPPMGCVVIHEARYLKNTGGFQVGHWGMTLAQIIGELKKQQQESHTLDADRGGREDTDKVYYVILDDDVARQGQAKRMVQVEQAFEHDEYARLTLAVVRKMLGIRLEKQNAAVTCVGGSIHVNAGRATEDDAWITLPGPKPELTIVDAAIEVLGCNQTSTDDVLIYNRKGTRHLTNHVEVAVYLQSVGYKTKTVYSNDLSPGEQICEMTRERKLIITPHGAQQSPLMFKRGGVGVVVVSPKDFLAECYRTIVKRTDPWFSVRGNVAWSCPNGRLCSMSQGAWRNTANCNVYCARRAKRRNIHMSLKAIADLLRIMRDEEVGLM